MLTALAALRRGMPSDPVSGWSLATLLLGLVLVGPFVALVYAMTGAAVRRATSMREGAFYRRLMVG